MTIERNHNHEYSDNTERKYAYDFDWRIRQSLLARVLPFLNKNGPTLEIGAFMGDMTQQILEHFADLHVLEASEKLTEHLLDRFEERINLRCATIEEVNLDERFDSIFLVHTLEHLDEPVGVLQKIGTLLRGGGRLVIAVPNAEALSRQIAVRMGLVQSNTAVTPGEFDHGHRRTYNLDTLLKDVRDANLKIVDHGGVLLKPFSNRQFDLGIETGLISEDYVTACDELAREYPKLSASIYVIVEAAAS